MFPVSQRFRDAVRTTHRSISWVEIVDRNEVVQGVIEGKVKYDSTAVIQGSIEMTVADKTGYYLDRGLPTDPLTRFGSEVRPWRGVVFPDGDIEAVPLGTFRVDSNVPEEREGGAYELKIKGRDRSSIANRPTSAPVAIANGTPVNEAIIALVTAAVPSATFELTEVPWTTGPLLVPAGNPTYAQAVELASASGLVLGVDRLGVFRTHHGLDPTDDVVWFFDEGEDCTFTEVPSVERGAGDATPNGFIVEGKSNSVGGSSSGIRAEAWDDDPRSPTWRGGPYGEVPRFVTSEKVQTQAQAQVAAELLLRQRGSEVQSLKVQFPPAPQLDTYDVAWVRRSAIEVDHTFYFDTLEIPLAADEAMEATLGYHFGADEAALEARISDLL